MTTAHRRVSIKLFASILALQFLAASCGHFKEPVSLAFRKVTNVTDARTIGEPFGIASTGDTVFISDGANNTIWKLSSGIPTRFATGLNTPSAIALLPNGELVVADTGSHTIRSISSTGAVTILAGVENVAGSDDGTTGTATFNAPVGLAAAKDGSIFVSDTYNDRIRVIRDGRVSTIAGSDRGFADGVGTNAKFDTPLGIAVWNDKLLVADSMNARVRVVEKTGEVWTLGGNGEKGRVDGWLSTARFNTPTAIAVDGFGQIFIADADSLRVIGRRAFPFVETLAGDRSIDGRPYGPRFSRPSGLAIGPDGKLYVADSDNRVVRALSDEDNNPAKPSESPTEEQLPLATRWPYDPPQSRREIAGTLGEIRGEMNAATNKPHWFHNGLDIAGAYGETAKFLRDETVLDPHSTANFATARELLRLPLLGYIHLRLGRDKDDRPFPDPRFQFERDASGKLVDVRVRRGTRFSAGDAIGTLNAMNHVHLIAGRQGHEINAFAALTLPGVTDTIAPVIEDVKLFTQDWREIRDSKVTRPTRVVIRAYDRVDGNTERRRLGVYRVGYQLFSNGAPLGGIQWTIRFERAPSNDAVPFAYAEGSRSGYTPDTIFNYIATNRVDGDNYQEDFLSPAQGSYTLRVFAADYFGNVTTRDIEVGKE